MHEISQYEITKWWQICKPNPKTSSRDYEFLNPKSRIIVNKFNDSTGIMVDELAQLY